MKVVVQRVLQAEVTVENQSIAKIDKGLLVYVAIHMADQLKDMEIMAKKITNLRILADDQQKMNLSILTKGGSILVVPQFTLYAQIKGQNRPFFGVSAQQSIAQKLYNYFLSQLAKRVKIVKTGVFAAYMQVESINDGPVTIILDSDQL